MTMEKLKNMIPDQNGLLALVVTVLAVLQGSNLYVTTQDPDQVPPAVADPQLIAKIEDLQNTVNEMNRSISVTLAQHGIRLDQLERSKPE